MGMLKMGCEDVETAESVWNQVGLDLEKVSGCVWTPTTAHFVCLPHVTHLIQLISSLVEITRLKLGVWWSRDPKCAVVWGSRTGL